MLDVSRLYELLGFREQSPGRAGTSAWWTLHQDGCSFLCVPRIPSTALTTGLAILSA
jgi:hypothetical protein